MPTALHPQTQMTFKFDGEILPRDYGFPIKIRIPTKLGFKNPKYVIAMAVTNNDPGGYWENKGYNWFSGAVALTVAARFPALRSADTSAAAPRDEARAALEGDVVPQPGEGDHEAVAHLDQEEDVDHAPEQPAEKSRELKGPSFTTAARRPMAARSP